MTDPPAAHLVDADPVAAARRLHPDATTVDALPDDGPYDLSSQRLVWPVTVEDDTGCRDVLEATLRGVRVVVRLGPRVDPDVAARFVDELARAAGVTSERPPARAPLTEEQLQLLQALATGATVDSAARQLGISARTASRRLTDARRTLGVRTTAEAIRRAGVG